MYLVGSLAGKKGRKWRQSLLHLGKPLAEYNLTCSEQHLVQSVVGGSLSEMNIVDMSPCSVQLSTDILRVMLLCLPVVTVQHTSKSLV